MYSRLGTMFAGSSPVPIRPFSRGFRRKMMMPGPAPAPAGEAEFVVWARSLPESDPGHHADSVRHLEEMVEMVKRVPRAEATLVAVADGNWSDLNTWDADRVPQAGDRVLVSRGKAVTYDVSSGAAIDWIRVDGTLTWDRTQDTRLVVDTCFVDMGGGIDIGTASDPIPAGVTVEIELPDGGDIDTSIDPLMQSRGFLGMGPISVHGAAKTGWVFAAENLAVGAGSVTLGEVPEGWAAGDRILLPGTYRKSWNYQSGAYRWTAPEDEVMTIAGIDGAVVTFTGTTAFRHNAPVLNPATDPDYPADPDAPQPGEFRLPRWPVANLTRNVRLSTPGDAPSHRRGHLMMMAHHSPGVAFASFTGMGRTDKSLRAHDSVSRRTELSVAALPATENLQGRYPIHIHRSGLDHAMAIEVRGCVVEGSPGWGITHHNGHADLTDNVVWKAFGTGIMAEDGGEWGTWDHNLVATCTGVNKGISHVLEKAADDMESNDMGRMGSAYWMRSRVVKLTRNGAINAPHGYVWNSRRGGSSPRVFATQGGDAQRVWYGRETADIPSVHSDKPVIQQFDDCWHACGEFGAIVIKDTADQRHDGRTMLNRFSSWEVIYGFNGSYTGHYTMNDFQLYFPRENTTHQGKAYVVAPDFKSVDMVFVRPMGRNLKNGQPIVHIAKRPSTPGNREYIVLDGKTAGSGTTVLLDGDVLTDDEGNPVYRIMTSAELNQGVTPGFTPDSSRYDSQKGEFLLQGDKTDSIGTRKRWFDPISEQRVAREEIEGLLIRDGYWTTDAGVKVLMLPDFISDRVTGAGYAIDYPIEPPGMAPGFYESIVYNGPLTGNWAGWEPV